MNNRDISRRSVLAVGIGGVATACVPFGKTSPFWGTIGANVGPRPGKPIDPAYIASLPYASMMAWFDGGAKALIVLGEITGDRRYTWYSAERQSITTFGPFVVAALGLDVELRGTLFGGGWQVDPSRLVGGKLVRSLDILAEGERVQVPLTSTFKAATGLETVAILDKSHRLRKVSEQVRYAGRVRHTNEYWVDPSTGRCWKSRQVAVPTLPALNLEVTKYPTV